MRAGQQTRPLAFEPNAGQTDATVRFLVHGPGSTLFFTPDGVTLSVASGQPDPKTRPQRQGARARSAAPAPPTVVQFNFIGANPQPALLGGNLLGGHVNYFLGNNPAQWQTNLPTYDSITYPGLYPGVELTYSGADGQLKGTYSLAPGADPACIRWRYSGLTTTRVDREGNLQLQAGDVTLTEQAPVAWQTIAGQRVPVNVRYSIALDGSIGFAAGPYERTQPLTLDPTLTYSTYLGGSAEEQGWGIAVDSTGSAYVTGWTASSDFPRQSPYQPTYGGGGYDAYVAKLNPAGSALVYSTFLGGSLVEEGMSVAVDAAGNAYLTGRTNSANFPLMNPLQPGCSSCPNALDSFVTKLNATGSALVYSTFLGGSDSDEANSIAVDSGGNAYIAGGTYSGDFPRMNPIQPIFGGADDAFLTKINAAGAALVYSTYLGGTAGDYGWTVAVDGLGEAAVTGLTLSGNFPHVNAIQPANAGGGDAFITKLNAGGSAYIFSTYFGGSNLDDSEGVAMDATGNVYVGGFTASSNFPLANPYQPTNHGGYDAFAAKLSATGAGPLYSTYLGGGNDDLAYAIAVDGAGAALLSGQTTSGDFPLANPIQSMYAGNGDVFVTKLQPAGTGLGYSTYLGGTGNDYSSRIATDGAGSAYVTGWSDSTNFPTANPIQPALAGVTDALVVKISEPLLTPTATPTVPDVSTPTATAPPILTPTPSLTATVCPVQFNDVNLTHPFYPYVRCLACRGIISGYDCGGPGEPCPGSYFRPYSNITRGQVAKIVAASAGYGEAIPSTQQTFADVPPSQPFWLWIERAALHGVISGYQCGQNPNEPCDPQHRPYFRPGTDVTRGQLAKIDANAAGYQEIVPSTQQSFTDVLYGDAFWVYIERVNLHGIISGYTCGLPPAGPCDPQQRPYFLTYNNITRGQAAKVVANTFFPNCQTPARR